MERFNIKGTHSVPEIDFNPETGEFFIFGRLISVNGEEYKSFRPLLDWVAQYAENPSLKTVLDIDLEYCSSGGTKLLFQLFKVFENMHLQNRDVLIVWHYFTDDEDSLEKGYQFQKLLKVPIQIKAHTNRN
ncbi:MAG: DUF1987 domain-containing protein [Bacteroidales bacterium]